jgi:hypothetical protein
MPLNDLVFTDINDTPSNPRLGLGYHQLYDPTSLIGLISKLPDVTRVGDTITLYWDSAIAQQYDLDQPTIDKGWLSFNVSPNCIFDPVGDVYYTLFDHQSNDLQTSPERTIAVNRRVPGGLDPETDTAINEAMAPCTVSPDPVSSPTATVTVSIPAWINQELGDELTVMWNNIRVPLAKLQTLGPVDVIIPGDVLAQGGSSDKLMVNYEIRDLVDNYSLVSPSTYVRVEIDPDALTAPRVDEADRTTLILDLEALGDNDAHVTIPTYVGNGNPYEVTLSWVGKTPTADISLNLPPQTVDDPAFDHATFTIPNAHLKLIAGGSAVVRYSLVQQGVTEPKQSKTTSITLTGLPVELAAPVVVEAGGTAIIDLALVTGNSVTVSIAAYSGQSAGDKVLLSWKGTPKDGGPVNYTAEYTIKAGEELLGTTFIVLRENLDPLADGTLELTYQVVFQVTGNTQNSPSTTYSIIAAVSETLPAPVVAGVTQGGTLNPGLITDGVRVTVHYDSMLATDKIRVAWFGEPSFVEVQGNASGTVQVTFPNSVVAASLGQSVVVRYGVTHTGGTEASSEMVQFSVGTLTESQLPTPMVTEAQNGVLDLNTFAGAAHLMVPKWTLSAVGQRVWLTVSGPGGVPTLPILTGYPISTEEANNGIARDIPRAELTKYANGSEMTVACKMTFDGGESEASAIAFPRVAYIVRVTPALTIDQSVMTLSGIVVRLSWPTTGLQFLDNAQTRVARGGVPPYTYSSSNVAVATVSPSGEVVGQGNGGSLITVQDSAQARLSYTVNKTNAYSLAVSAGAVTAQQAIDWKNSIPGATLTGYGIPAMIRVYGPNANWPLPTNSVYWTCDPTGCVDTNSRVAYTPYDGQYTCRAQTSTLWLAWCLKPYP